MSHKNDRDDTYADSKSDDEDVRRDAKSDSKADSKSDNKMSDEELLKQVQEFFYCNEELADLFESFINKRSGVVDLSTEEYKLEYTTVFNEYKRLFEDRIEGFITETLGSTVEDFYYALKSKSDAVEESSESIFAQILIAVTDFDVFMTMMREAAISNDRLSAESDHKIVVTASCTNEARALAITLLQLRVTAGVKGVLFLDIAGGSKAHLDWVKNSTPINSTSFK